MTKPTTFTERLKAHMEKTKDYTLIKKKAYFEAFLKKENKQSWDELPEQYRHG